MITEIVTEMCTKIDGPPLTTNVAHMCEKEQTLILNVYALSFYLNSPVHEVLNHHEDGEQQQYILNLMTARFSYVVLWVNTARAGLLRKALWPMP